jgi:cobalt-zinc-cadmium efflux system protein
LPVNASHRHTHGTPTRRLTFVLCLTVAYTVVEVIGGLLSDSLALLADAGHMMIDNVALFLALVAAWFAQRPADPARTYGYHRVEILAALANGVTLVVVCGFIAWEAWERFREPAVVRSGLMAAVAAGGLAVNFVAARILHGGHGLNVRAAYLHVLGDLLGSLGALAAAALIALYGFTWADPLASLLICVVILVSTIRLLFDSLNVLMEGAPSHLDIDEIRRCLAGTAGVDGVHDLHVWSLVGGTPLLTAHLVVDHTIAPTEVVRQAGRALRDRFGIDHSTLQVDPPDYNVLLNEPGAAVAPVTGRGSSPEPDPGRSR